MGLILTFVEVTGEKLVGRPFWLPTSSKGFGAHVRDFKSYLKFLRNLENKICTPEKPGIFIFQIISRMTKNVENRATRFSKSYLTTKNEICSLMSPWLKTYQKFHFADKRSGFFIKINGSFKKYNHVYPGVSGRNRHMLSISS